ncbi:ABC transporter permease [Prosthecobacter sp.]|uniref:ABC transporter permease n=1 Tax=Prosthecobacter sp. TaxID=1965333 RepID=UPI001D22723C|nr:ABC transporter permease [Prosthecobacter sp.]MCB1278102.1 ABC transporter permease [Prosthecobacter sp.]
MSHTTPQSVSPMRAAWQRLMRQRIHGVALAFLVLLVLACAIGPMFSPYTQAEQDLELKAAGPSASHWLGTDSLGRDMATRILYGGRVSLEVAFLATAVAAIIGVGYGMVSGLAGGRVDAVMMRIVDIIYCFPFINFVILLMVIFGRQFWLIFVAIGAVEWLTMSRVVRGQVLALKNLEFVVAARANGAGFIHLLFKHLLPNLAGTIIIYAGLTIPGIMLLEASLSFLGLGIQPPDASWGVLLGDGSRVMDVSPWLLLYPGLFFSATLLALNTLGDGLRDALDPKSMSQQ